MIQKGNLFFPLEETKNKARFNDEKIYEEVGKNPIKFWSKVAKELKWQKPWKEDFIHNPPYFKWFVSGKINLSENCLDRHLPERKDKVALIWEPELKSEEVVELTYEELFKKVNKFSNALLKIGIRKGDVVGIYLPMIPETVISMLACARIGAIHTVIFSAFSSEALNTRLNATTAKILITADGYYRRGEVIKLKEKADLGIKNSSVEKIIIVQRLKEKIIDNINNKENNFYFDELVKNENENCVPAEIDSEDPLFILPESGTGGAFLPILHTTGGYTVQAYFTGKAVFDLKDSDVFWSTADVGWVTGHTYSIYSPLLNGATIVIFEGAPDFPEKDRWAEIIEKYNVSIFYTAPTAIRMFAKYGAEILKKYQFKSLRILGSVGEPIDESTWKWYFKEIGKEKCPILDTWWQTETGGIMISSLPGIGPFCPSFAGRELPGIKIDILDEKGKSLPTGEKGNLVILSPFSPGMLRDVYKNSKAYIENYWSKYGKNIYFTSDGAFRDKNGLIKIVGRVDDVIKVAGHRITTVEIENSILKNKKVEEVAVIGVPDQIKGEIPVVFVDVKDNEEKEIKEEIINQIKKDIGPIALPKEIYITDDLPKTRSGKIMRGLLKKIITEDNLGDISSLANEDSVQKIKDILKK